MTQGQQRLPNSHSKIAKGLESSHITGDCTLQVTRPARPPLGETGIASGTQIGLQILLN